MKTYMTNLKRIVTQLILAVFTLNVGFGTAVAAPVPGPGAKPIDTGTVDLTVLTPTSAVINNARLVTWRTGSTYTSPPTASGMSFQYYTNGGNQNINFRTNQLIKDNTGNDQGDLWSDNAIELAYQSPNSLNQPAILIYTYNKDNGATDPLFNVSSRGGLVGCDPTLSLTDQPIAGTQFNVLSCINPISPYRASVVPLLWKAVGLSEIQADSQANVNGTNPIATALFMPTEVINAAGGPCPVEGPYTSGTARPNNGFCDFSTHFIADENSNVNQQNPGAVSGSWYTYYGTSSQCQATPTSPTCLLRSGAFNYSTIVGPFGPALTETGQGAGVFNPAYFVLGMKASVALRAHYGTTIFLEVLAQ